MNEWKKFSIGEITDWYSGGTPRKSVEQFWNGDIPWVTAKTLTQIKISDSEFKITKEGLKSGSRMANQGDILLLVRGSGLYNDIPICIVDSPVAFNQDIKALRIKKNSDIEPDFLLYWLIANKSNLRNILEATGIGAGKLDTEVVKSIKLNIPPEKERLEILKTAKCLFAKIENLRKQNETLEAIAQTLFKHWFIDFEFPNEDGKPYKSSGGEVRSTELGEIPKDWRVGNMQDIIDVRDGTHDSPKQVESGFHLITSKHLKKEGIDFNSAYLISENDYIEVNKRSKVNRFDILLSMIGTVGLIYFVLDTEINFAIKNIGLFRTSQNLKYAEFIYLFLQSSYGNTYFKTRLAGTTQSYITLGSLREMPLIIPPLTVIENFRRIIKPIFDKFYLNNLQIQTLTKTRNKLLPKLMSGQIRVKE